MPSDHIVRSFDEELTALHQAIIDIGELSHSQLSAAVEALASHDTARAAAVVKGDSEVDQLERDTTHRFWVLAGPVGPKSVKLTD